MDVRYMAKSRFGQNEAGPSSSFQRSRNDQSVQRSFNNDVSAAGQRCNQPLKYPKDDKDSRQYKGNYHRHSRSNSFSSECSSLRLIESGKPKSYICPNCKQPYNYYLNNNTLSGKVPRILPCKHTVCEECIMKGIKTTNHIQCSICTKSEFGKKPLCEYNHYVLGQLTCSRFNKSIMDLSNIALVSTDSRSRLPATSDKFVPIDQKEEKCGFKDCMNSGTVSCIDCCGIYCKDCDDALHKSGKQLMSHKRVSNKKATFELNKCTDHSMIEEIYCKDCDETSCCYCVLEKHEGHSRVYLGRLSDDEEKDLLKAYDTAKLKRKQLLISQRKISKTDDTDGSNLEMEIAQIFADIHAQLYFIEKNLCEEVKSLKNGNSNLMELNETISSNIKRLNYMINCVDQRSAVKFNLRMLLNKLKEMENLPTVLVSSDTSVTPKLIIDEEIDDLHKFFKLDIPTKVTFSLMEVDELPQEYQEEIELPSTKFNQSKSSSESDFPRNIRSKHNFNTKDCNTFKQQSVFMTHINSLDSFYVHFTDEYHSFKKLENEISNHVNRTNIGVERVEIKELYLAQRLCDKGRWSRVRVLEEVHDGNRYKVRFIDFGNSAVVRNDEIIYISASIAKKRPFAYECRLYNPSSFEWPKDTHLELAKLLDCNKELVMYIKESSSNIYTVELNINTSTGGLCSVTDLLIFGCDALKKKPIVETPLLNKIFENSDVYIVGNSYEVCIRHISDPWHIYIQRTSYESTFNNLIKHMEGFYKNSRCDIHLPIKDSYVVIHYGSKKFGSWHRAKILDVIENKRVVKVQLIDLGQHLQVSWRDTRKLAEPFKKSECLVVCTRLADLAPRNADSWSDGNELQVVKYLKQYLEKTQQLKILVSNNDPLEVVLFEPLETYDININALLVEKELVLSTGKLTNTKIWIHHEDKDDKHESNILFIKDDSDDEEIEPEIYGHKSQVEIVQFESPSSFYVSFVSRQKDAEKLHEEVQIHFKSLKNYKTDREWKENDKVVVFDSSDKMYYRGIIKTKEVSKFCVHLLDKPGDLWVNSEKLRCMPSYFEKIFPNTVFKCHLANIKPAGDSDKWSKLSLEWFENLFKKHEDIFIKKIGDDQAKTSIPVTMWYSKVIQGSALEPSYRNYISIDKKVVNAGLAFWVNNEISHNILSVPDEPAISKPVELEVNDDGQLSDNTNETIDSLETVKYQTPIEVNLRNIKRWLPALKLSTKEFFAYITCAENEGYLYIREEKMQKLYEEMEKKIKKHFDSIPKAGYFTLRENQMVMVHSEEYWYRAVVLSVIDKTTAQIMMVDFGSDHIVKLTDLHNKIMYPEIPVMVSRIKLYNIQSVKKTWKDWEVEILINTAPAYGKVIIRSSLHDTIPLADVYDENGVCLNDKLVELCPNLSRSQPNEQDTFHEMSYTMHETDFKQKPESPQFPKENNAHCEEIELNAKEKDDETIDTKIEIEDKVTEGAQDINESNGEMKNEDAEEQMYEDAEEDLNTEVIKEITVEVQEEESPENVRRMESTYIYHKIEKNVMAQVEIVAVYDYKTISLYNPDDYSTEEGFEALTNSISENVETLEYLKVEDIKVGVPCLSLFEDDNQWYRAKILKNDALQCGYVTVIYVDYGNFEIVQLSNLKTMKPQWLDFPARFIEASIAFTLLKKDQENVLLKHVQSLAGEKKFIEVVENDPVLVQVYNKIGDIFELHYEAFVRNGIVEI